MSHAQTITSPAESPWPWIGAGFLAVTLGIILALGWKRSGGPAGKTAFALGWILVTLLPHIGIVPVGTFVAERFLYVPLAGLSMLAGIAWDGLASGTPVHRLGRGVLCAAFLGMTVLAWNRVGAWRNELTLWQSAVQEEPRNAFAHACCAEAYAHHGEYDAAIHEYRRALTSQPSLETAFIALNNLANIYNRLNRPRVSLILSVKALRIYPEAATPLYNESESYRQLGQAGKAAGLRSQWQKLSSAAPPSSEGL